MNFHHRLEKSEESGTTSVYKSCAVKNVPLVPVQSLLFILTKGALLKTCSQVLNFYKVLKSEGNIKQFIQNVYDRIILENNEKINFQISCKKIFQ